MSRFDIVEHAIKATRNQNGQIWECGCYQGDFAAKMLPFIERRILRLFDTFAGMPYSGEHDEHRVGVMKADQEAVVNRFRPWEQVKIHAGIMPATFAGLEDAVLSVVNLDVDNEQPIRECLPWLYKRLHSGGYLIIDDYSCGSCPGAKLAVDEFLKDKQEILYAEGDPNPQAYFIKL